MQQSNPPPSLAAGSVAEIASSAPTKSAQDSRNIYVSHLPQSVDAKYFRELFEPFGTVTNARLLLDVGTGFSRGIGFVMYEEESAAQEAVSKMNKLHIHGGTIQVRFADSKHVETITVATKHLLVRNIPKTVLVDEIRGRFASFGTLVDMEYHPQSAACGGPCPHNVVIISYENNSDSEKALDAVDGKLVFPVPNDPNHPRILAKYVTDILKEKKKSVLVPSNRGPTAFLPSSAASSASSSILSRTGGAPPSVISSIPPTATTTAPVVQQITTYTMPAAPGMNVGPPPGVIPTSSGGLALPPVATGPQPTTVHHVYPQQQQLQQVAGVPQHHQMGGIPTVTHVYHHQGPPQQQMQQQQHHPVIPAAHPPGAATTTAYLCPQPNQQQQQVIVPSSHQQMITPAPTTSFQPVVVNGPAPTRVSMFPGDGTVKVVAQQQQQLQPPPQQIAPSALGVLRPPGAW